MEPITRDELYLAAAAGEYDGDLPDPKTRLEYYLKKIAGGASVNPEDIDAAIEAYLNTHDADIVTEQELSDALGGYYNKAAINNALEGKADVADIPDVSDFVTTAELAEKQNALTAGDNISIETINDELTISATDTTYSDATQQTHGLMSTADKTKLDGITAAKMQAWDAAEQNVNADWTAESGDAQILHKPDLSVYALAANVTKSALGIDNVDNTSDASKPISTATQTALDGKQNVLTFDNAPAEHSENPVKSSGVYSALAGKISVSAKGANGGVAELDANGKVPSSQLPSYVDDVLSYNSASAFPATGEDGKIYIAKDTNLSYRWTGSEYGVISPSLALGNTSSTAYRGDWGAEDRAAIGTLTDLQTSEKNNLVAAVNEIKNALTFDSTPTENSTNPVTSGGVYTALSGKADATATQTALNAKQDALTAGDNVSIATVNGVLTISATDTTYSDATQQAHGLMSTADKTKLDSVQTGAAAVSVTQTLASGTKIGTVTVNGTGTDLYCETNTDTTYSAGTGLSLSGTTFSNSAPNVKSDWNAAAGTNAEILNKPTLGNAASKDVGTGSNQVAAGNHNHTGVYAAVNHNHDGTYAPYSHSHSYAAVNHSHRTAFSITTGVNMVPAANRTLSLGDVDVSNYEAIEIRYLMYSYRVGSTDYNCYSTVRAMNTAGGYGNIPVIRFVYSSGTLKICVCRLTLSGSNLTLADAGGLSTDNNDTFYIGNVIGYR